MSKVHYKLMVFDSLNDVILLRKEGFDTSFRDFAKKGYKSVGCLAGGDSWWDNISAANAKTFVGLERIMFLVNKQKASCEMTLVPTPEVQPPIGEVYEWSKTSDVRTWAQILRDDLEKASKRRTAYQKKQVKQGKSSPDWKVPTVEVAYLKPVCEVISPYSY